MVKAGCVFNLHGCNRHITGAVNMVYQQHFQRIRFVLAALLFVASGAGSVAALAATTDYDGVWDVYFACDNQGDQKQNFVSFRNVIVKNGEGATSYEGSLARFSLAIAFENNEVKMRKHVVGLRDANLDWVFKMKGDLFDDRSFNLIGVSYQQAHGSGVRGDGAAQGSVQNSVQAAGQGAQDCRVGGVLREPVAVKSAAVKSASVNSAAVNSTAVKSASVSQAAKPTKLAAPASVSTISAYDGVWRLKAECLSSGTLASPYEEFDLKIVDGKGSVMFTTNPADPTKASYREYQVFIENKTISLIRTMTRVSDPSRVWQMKVKDEMMSERRMQIHAMTVPVFQDAQRATAGAPSACWLSGYR